MKEYKVKVYEDRTEWFNLEGELHREDGPAIEWCDGGKEWYLNGKRLSEEEFNKRTKSCSGKIVEIGGKKYKLIEL